MGELQSVVIQSQRVMNSLPTHVAKRYRLITPRVILLTWPCSGDNVLDSPISTEFTVLLSRP
jgi:hypothetical protein